MTGANVTPDQQEEFIRTEVKKHLQPLVRTEVRGGIIDVLQLFGMDTNNPLEQQADYAFLREERKKHGSTGRTVRTAALNTGVMAMILAAWEGFKHYVSTR